MKKYFAYIRVSTARQGEFGVSLQQQKDAIERYAAKQKLEIERWFEEQETAAKSGRPLFGQMIRLLRQQKAAGVIIHKIDRSARNLSDWAELGQLIDSGTDVHFASEALDLQSRGGRLSADIQAVVAADYIRNLREETKKGFYGRLKQGLFPMPARIGYLNVGKGKPKIIDPQMGPLVKHAFELYASGRFTLLTLNQEMFRLGLRGRTGKRITRNGYSTILRNPFYMGIIRIKKNSETYQGVHKPIVSKQIFERVQAVLDGRFMRRTVSHDFLFRTMLKCRTCCYSLCGEQCGNIIYYRCHTKECPSTCIRQDVLEAVVLEKLQAIQFSGSEMEYLQAMVAGLTENAGHEREQLISSLNLQIKQLDDRIMRLTDAFVDQLIDKATFEERKEALLIARTGITEKLKRLEAGGDPIAEFLRKILERAESAYSLYKSGNSEDRRKILEEVTSNRTVSGKDIDFIYHLPYQEIAKRQKLHYGSASRRPPLGLKQLFEKLLKFAYTGKEPEELLPAA